MQIDFDQKGVIFSYTSDILGVFTCYIRIVGNAIRYFQGFSKSKAIFNTI